MVIIPTRAAPHSQKSAPGPPRQMAEVTPATEPVPTVPASAVVMAWKGVISPGRASTLSGRWNTFPRVCFMAWGKCRNCIPPVRMVSQRPMPISRTRAGAPQTIRLTISLTAISSSMTHPPFVPLGFPTDKWLYKQKENQIKRSGSLLFLWSAEITSCSLQPASLP